MIVLQCVIGLTVHHLEVQYLTVATHGLLKTTLFLGLCMENRDNLGTGIHQTRSLQVERGYIPGRHSNF